jgi:hypothetical protein
MSDQREPDHTEDPREQDVGQGYPETAPEKPAPDDDEAANDE